MLTAHGIGGNVGARNDEGSEPFGLRLEAGGQNDKSHDLDEPDIFFFDIVLVGVRVEHTEGIFGSREIVAQHEVKLIVVSATAGNGSHRVVRHAVGLGKYHGSGVAVCAPRVKYAVGKCNERCTIRRAQAYDRHRPADDARAHTGKIGKIELHRDGRARHGEFIAAALHMVVREYRTADDRQVGI